MTSHDKDDARYSALVERVREMRAAQKEYFRERSPQWLNQSKQLERQVDRMLSDLENRQKNLFD
jgi:hypothetical protein